MEKTVVFFGDSNTYGRNPETGGRYPRAERFTGIVQKRLEGDWYVVEEGRSGRTTVFEDPVEEGKSGLSYLYACLMSHSPIDQLVIMLGTNDSQDRYSASPITSARGIKRLVLKAMEAPCWADEPHILVVAPVPIAEHYMEVEESRAVGPGAREKTLALAGEYQKVCESLKVDFFDAGTTVPAPHPRDAVHLSREGHRALAEYFVNYLSSK